MERDVVLADEVDGAGVVALPPIAPGLGVAAGPSPFLCRREVADDGLEPDVDPLTGTQIVDRQLDAPIEVPGDGTILKTLVDPTLGEVEYVPAPTLAGAQPLPQPLGEIREPQVEVFGGTQFGGRAGDLGSGVDQFFGVQRAATVFTLVTASLRVLAVRASALDVAIGQEPVDLGVVVLVADPTIDVAIIQEAHEDVLSDLGVVGGAGGGVAIPADAEPIPVGDELGVVATHDVGRGDPLGIGPNGDRGAVDIRSAHHDHPVADQALVAGVDVGWQVGASQVSKVTRSGGVRPSHGHQHRRTSRRTSNRYLGAPVGQGCINHYPEATGGPAIGRCPIPALGNPISSNPAPSALEA